MGRKVVRDAREERLGVTRAGAVRGAQPETPPRLAASLDERLAGVPVLRAQLNEGSDRLNDALREVQSLIGSIRIGVTAFVELPNGKTLAYGRLGREWCVHVEDDESDVRTPILKASREDRLAAADAMEALVEALSESAARTSAEVKALTASLGELREAIVEGSQ